LTFFNFICIIVLKGGDCMENIVEDLNELIDIRHIIDAYVSFK